MTDNITPELIERERDQLATLQASLGKLKAEYAAILATHADEKAFLDQARTHHDELEAQLRGHLVTLYYTDGVKTSAAGMTVQMREHVEYDEDAAVRWCLENGRPELLTINKARFEAMAKTWGDLAPTCVTVDRRPVATVSPNLAKAIDGEKLKQSREETE